MEIAKKSHCTGDHTCESAGNYPGATAPRRAARENGARILAPPKISMNINYPKVSHSCSINLKSYFNCIELYLLKEQILKFYEFSLALLVYSVKDTQ